MKDKFLKDKKKRIFYTLKEIENKIHTLYVLVL